MRAGVGGAALTNRLITQAGEAFVPPEDVQDVENARGGRSSGQRHPKWLGDGAELEVILLGEIPHGSLRGVGAPVVNRLQRRPESADQSAGLRRQHGGGLGIELE